MSEQYYLYTVTGLRDPFYAVVDLETGRAWTSPTKDGAIRQARDAGILDFAEKTITREMFLRSLGIEVDPRTRTHRDSPANDTPAESKAAAPPPPGSFFVPSPESESGGELNPYIPSKKPVKQWPSTPPKPATPFAANAPIPMPGEEIIAPPDDVLVVPSPQRPTRRNNPFTDQPPTIPDDLVE